MILRLTRKTSHAAPFEEGMELHAENGVLIPLVIGLQIYEHAAITKWVHLHHTVPLSPAQPASLCDLKPCPEMQRLLRQMQHEFGLRLQAQDDT